MFSWNTLSCAYQGIRNVGFSENWTCFVFLEAPILRFALLPYYRRNVIVLTVLDNSKYEFLSSHRICFYDGTFFLQIFFTNPAAISMRTWNKKTTIQWRENTFNTRSFSDFQRKYLINVKLMVQFSVMVTFRSKEKKVWPSIKTLLSFDIIFPSGPDSAMPQEGSYIWIISNPKVYLWVNARKGLWNFL